MASGERYRKRMDYLRERLKEEERSMLTFYKCPDADIAKCDGSFLMSVFKRGRKQAIREMADNVLRSQKKREATNGER